MTKLLVQSAMYNTLPERRDEFGNLLPAETSRVFSHERVRNTVLNIRGQSLGIVRIKPEVLAKMERSHSVSRIFFPPPPSFLASLDDVWHASQTWGLDGSCKRRRWAAHHQRQCLSCLQKCRDVVVIPLVEVIECAHSWIQSMTCAKTFPLFLTCSGLSILLLCHSSAAQCQVPSAA